MCGGPGCLTAYVSSSAIEAETNRPLRRAPASVVERTGMMIGRAVASAVAVFDLRLVLLAGPCRRRSAPPLLDAARPRARPAQPAGPPPRRAPTAPSTASRSTTPCSAARRRWSAPPALAALGAGAGRSVQSGDEPDLRPEAEAYREKVQAFLAEKLPADWAGIGRLEGDAVARVRRRGGAACCTRPATSRPGWPVEYGGGGLSPLEQVIIAEEFAKAGVPTGGPNDVFGIQMLGNTLLLWGTEEQKRHYLPRILSGEDRWCQGYSEPNAGSDLGSLGLRAELDGDQWVLNGQKIWTSAGHLADHIFTLARTDPDAPEAQGHLVPARRHAPAGHRGPPDPDDLRRERVQRGLLHRRRVPEGRRRRRRQQRLGGGDDAARLRARRGGGDDADPLPGRARPAAAAGQGARRRPTTR